MSNSEWTLLHWTAHKLIHWTYDLLILLHDWLLQLACNNHLWQTPEQRARNERMEIEKGL